MKPTKKMIQAEADRVTQLEFELAKSREKLKSLEEEAAGPATLKGTVVAVAHRPDTPHVHIKGYVEARFEISDGKQWTGSLLLHRSGYDCNIINSLNDQRRTGKPSIKITIEEIDE